MIMITKTSIPNELLSTKKSQKSYYYTKYSLKRVINIKETTSKIKKHLSAAICLTMGGSLGSNPSV